MNYLKYISIITSISMAQPVLAELVNTAESTVVKNYLVIAKDETRHSLKISYQNLLFSDAYNEGEPSRPFKGYLLDTRRCVVDTEFKTVRSTQGSYTLGQGTRYADELKSTFRGELDLKFIKYLINNSYEWNNFTKVFLGEFDTQLENLETTITPFNWGSEKFDTAAGSLAKFAATAGIFGTFAPTFLKALLSGGANCNRVSRDVQIFLERQISDYSTKMSGPINIDYLIRTIEVFKNWAYLNGSGVYVPAIFVYPGNRDGSELVYMLGQARLLLQQILVTDDLTVGQVNRLDMIDYSRDDIHLQVIKEFFPDVMDIIEQTWRLTTPRASLASLTLSEFASDHRVSPYSVLEVFNESFVIDYDADANTVFAQISHNENAMCAKPIDTDRGYFFSKLTATDDEDSQLKSLLAAYLSAIEPITREMSRISWIIDIVADDPKLSVYRNRFDDIIAELAVLNEPANPIIAFLERERECTQTVPVFIPIDIEACFSTNCDPNRPKVLDNLFSLPGNVTIPISVTTRLQEGLAARQ